MNTINLYYIKYINIINAVIIILCCGFYVKNADTNNILNVC